MKKYLLSLLFLAGCSGSINANVTVTINVPEYYGTISIPTGFHETVKDLKEKIPKKYKISVDQMRMTWGNPPRIAEDNMRLSEIRGAIYVNPIIVDKKRKKKVDAGEEKQNFYFPFIQRHKVGAGITIAALTAAVAGVMKIRSYRAIKNRLINTYQLGKLTPLQNKVWMATALASYRIPWYLRYLVNNTMGTLSDFVGANPRAVAELYYGHEPSQKERDAFIDNFFSTVQE